MDLTGNVRSVKREIEDPQRVKSADVTSKPYIALNLKILDKI